MNECTVLCFFNLCGTCMLTKCVDMTELVPEPEPIDAGEKV